MHTEIRALADIYMLIDESMQGIIVWMVLTERDTMTVEQAVEVESEILYLEIVASIVQPKSLKNLLCKVQGY